MIKKIRVDLMTERQKNYLLMFLTGLTLMMIFFVILMVYSVNAQITQILEFNEGDNLTLIQNCGLCTFVNISTVIDSNGDVIINNIAMNKRDTFFFYDINDTLERGTYIVNTYGDSRSDGNITASSYYLIINPDDRNLFYFDTGNIFNMVVLVLALFGAVIFYFLRLPMFSGFIVMVGGFLLLFNDFNIPLSMIVVSMGVVILFIPTKR